VHTEPLFTDGAHDVFFNRGVASSQAYAREFQNQKPDEIADAEKRKGAFQWLSRDLDEALFKFIDQAQAGDTLLGCFYEFRHAPAADRLKAAIDRGVTVRLILDAKVNEFTDKDGTFHESFPRVDNKATVAKAKLPDSAIALWREHNPSDIQHNKFLVLLRGAAEAPSEVWTGSTNLSLGAIHGQTNVGHWVRNPAVAAAYRNYWQLVQGDPGTATGDTRTEANAKRKRYRDAVMALSAVPVKWQDVARGSTTIFSPRSGGAVLDMYVGMVDEADKVACITLAFGINKRFKDRIADNTPNSHITFFLLEKRDVKNPKATTAFVSLNARNNVYQAWGSFLRDPLHQWTRETNAKALGLNTHVSYVHSKFLVKDPLGNDPLVVTGSANFSDASTNDNDENMLAIRGDKRVADIYFTEFNRLFFHYYFRSVQEAVQGRQPPAGAAADGSQSLFLAETDAWLAKYEPGTFRRKRVELFTAMSGAKIL
jgi:phosphatidylserine/phosphatidylglycerophosphate/cardiolipin synthase-like enzyme